MGKATIHTDGGARGNPGPAGIGVVIEISGQKHNFKEYIGHATNNQAEYQAVILALTKAKELGIDEIDLFLDSELVQQQLNQKYKVKNQDLAQLFVKAWNLSLGFKKIKYVHVGRNDNKEADKLVNAVLDENSAKMKQ